MTHKRLQLTPSHIKIISFVGVGAFNTLFNVMVFDVLVFLIGIGNLVANFISLLISIVVSYLLNKFFVFKDNKRVTGKQLGSFMAGTFVIQLITQHSAVWLLGEKYTGMGISFYRTLEKFNLHFSREFVVLNTAKGLGVVFSIAISFLFYDRLIFKISKQSS